MTRAFAFPYISHQRFCDLSDAHDARADQTPFAIAGIPYDGAVTNRPGARFAPNQIRQASHMLCDAIHPYFEVALDPFVGDFGDLDLPNTAIADVRVEIEMQAKKLLESKHMVWLGGDHSVTLPILRALYSVYQKPIAIIHFDAHCDTWQDHFGEPSGHGTWVYEAIQEGLIEPTKTIQIGIRSSGEKSAREYVKNQGGHIYDGRFMRGKNTPEALQDMISEIINIIDDDLVYLTLDIDCIDPAHAPGTGTPESFGLASHQVLTLLEELSQLNYVGMDCVEVSPPYDHSEMTSLLASQLVWTYLCGQVHKFIEGK